MFECDFVHRYECMIQAEMKECRGKMLECLQGIKFVHIAENYRNR